MWYDLFFSCCILNQREERTHANHNPQFNVTCSSFSPKNFFKKPIVENILNGLENAWACMTYSICCTYSVTEEDSTHILHYL